MFPMVIKFLPNYLTKQVFAPKPAALGVDKVKFLLFIYIDLYTG